MMKFSLILFLTLLITNNLHAQSIAPYAFNNGDGFSLSYAPNVEWSMGESISIASFKSSEYALNTGLLQPPKIVVVAEMVGGSKEFSSSKLKPEFSITGPGGTRPVKYAFYAVPGGNAGTITSIKPGGFERKDAFDVITRDFLNDQRYTVSYTIYAQKNTGTDNLTLIII